MIIQKENIFVMIFDDHCDNSIVMVINPWITTEASLGTKPKFEGCEVFWKLLEEGLHPPSSDRCPREKLPWQRSCQTDERLKQHLSKWWCKLVKAVMWALMIVFFIIIIMIMPPDTWVGFKGLNRGGTWTDSSQIGDTWINRNFVEKDKFPK